MQCYDWKRECFISMEEGVNFKEELGGRNVQGSSPAKRRYLIYHDVFMYRPDANFIGRI